MMRATALLLAGAVASTAALAGGYDERQSGDLSDDHMAPTSVRLTPGSNTIAGRFGARNGPMGIVTDRDYFRIAIRPGQVLSAIVLGNAAAGGIGLVSFIGVERGRTMTTPPTATSAEDLLGWTHFSEDSIGQDLLPDIGDGAGAIGFTPPLGPGVYSFWVQETAVCNRCGYQFDFQLSAAATD